MNTVKVDTVKGWHNVVGALIGIIAGFYLGCQETPVSVEDTEEQIVPSVPDNGEVRERLSLCEAFMVHAKVVAQNPEEGWMDIALELKDERTWIPEDQGRICIAQASFSLAFPSPYLEYRGEYCAGPPLSTDGQGNPCPGGWSYGNNNVVYENLPHPRGRISVHQYVPGNGVPMPAKGKRILGTARLWRKPGTIGMQKTYSYHGFVWARYETANQKCIYAGRSAWGHELTFGEDGTAVIVGPETQFCSIYPGCQRELNYCGGVLCN